MNGDLNKNELEITPASVELDSLLHGMENTEYEAVTDELLVKQLRLVKKRLNPDDSIVYYPCPGTDISPSVAFPGSRVIYVDTDPKAVHVLSAKGFEVYKESALEYNLETKASILVLINPSIEPELPSQQLAVNGLLLCNDYHGTASKIVKDSSFEPLGYIEAVGDKFVYREDASDRLKIPRRNRNMDELYIFKKRTPKDR